MRMQDTITRKLTDAFAPEAIPWAAAERRFLFSSYIWYLQRA